MVLAALGALAGLVQFVALGRLADILLAPGQAGPGELVTVVWLVVAGLALRGLLMGILLVLDEGTIVERGAHTDLLATGGRYAAFWLERSRARGWRVRA
jgi:hypothetical protein